MRIQSESGIFTTVITVDLQWEDEFLNWENITGIEFYANFTVQVPKLYLWAPSIFVWNSHDDNRILKFKNDSILKVTHSGIVTGQISTILNSECKMHLEKYAILILSIHSCLKKIKIEEIAGIFRYEFNKYSPDIIRNYLQHILSIYRIWFFFLQISSVKFPNITCSSLSLN